MRAAPLARMWGALAALAVLAGALWLRDPAVRYFVAAAAATLASLALAAGGRAPARRWAMATSGALALFAITTGLAQRRLARIDAAWPAYRASLVGGAGDALATQMDAALATLREAAARAVEAPADPREALAALRAAPLGAEQGVVLYRRGAPVAWAGRSYAPPSALDRPVAVVSSPFYIALEVQVQRGEARAIATAVVHAVPPADSLTDAIDERVARRSGVRGFEILPVSADAASGLAAEAAREGAMLYAPLGDTLLIARPLPPAPAEARGDALRRARAMGGLLLAVVVALLAAATWRREPSVGWRLLPLGVALACLALVPLNQLSNVTFLFDPAVYFDTVGGPYTASIGALLLTGAIVLLGMFVVLRAHAPTRSRRVSAAIALAVMLSAPFLLRVLSRGISPPIEGITTSLWLAWEVALFLVGAALLLGAAAAGSTAIGARRGLPPAVAPLLAAVAAIVAPVVLDAPARWPEWYVVLWILAIGALAVTRRHRALYFSAAVVAALGATTLAWRAEVGGRVALATGDVAGLDQERPEVETTLTRLGDDLAMGAAPASDAALLRIYAESDLEGSGFPVSLATWGADDSEVARVALAPVQPRQAELAGLLHDARATGAPQVRVLPGAVGVYHALAVPYEGGVVATVLVGPRTRLIRDDPDNALLGISPRERGTPPYSVSLSAVEGSAAAEERWYREGDELHGHSLVHTGSGPARAHIRIELRSLEVLLQRGALVVLLDLLLILALWALSVSPERAFWRWLRAQQQRWGASYRLRLTLALFAFFVIPAAVFAAWSWRQLLEGDLQSRELLVRETLRQAVPADTVATAAGTPQPASPLLAYVDGVLRPDGRPLLELLAPTGWFVPPTIHERLDLATEEETSELERVGDQRLLFGYRVVGAVDGPRLVLGAPAPGSEEALDRRRHDLGVLVMFATVLGAFAALWLSGVAARTLAEPIGRLRGAALALAEGSLEPPLPPRPPAEFVPVFSAFRRMARDIRESRAALEEAERRTSAVLRNVASGVVAVDEEGAVVLANPRAERLLGRAIALRAPLTSAMPPELGARLARFLACEDEEEELELVVEQRQLHARLTRLARGAGAVLTLDDVTELARVQRVLAWGEMARQVAHEIKNPLTPIRLGVQHLRRARADARADFDQILERNVGRILAEIDRLDQIARAFSRYGMAPAERQPPAPTDVAAVARDVVELERMGRDGVQWRLAGTDSPRAALAREDELREVLLNILENARLAGAREVAVRVAGEDGRVLIEVADDGHGIPAHLLPRIFEPHFSTRTSGSGLGLAISRQMIEGWGGDITIRSEAGHGTVVRIALVAG